MNEDLDRLLAYRNFLAAEDHLDELLYSPSSSEELEFLTGLKNEVEYLRDDVMPKETNKDFHCVVKHLSLAYEACREIAKATHDELDINRANACRGLLTTTLEKLWGRKIITCERCGKKEEDESRGIQGEGSGSTTEAVDNGLTGRSVQGISPDRIVSVSLSETSHNVGDEVSGTQPEITGRETDAPF